MDGHEGRGYYAEFKLIRKIHNQLSPRLVQPENMEKYKHQVYVHLADQTVLTVRENMQDFEKELAGKGFVRTHAAYIVALRYCRKFEKNDIVLEGDVKVPVSRERRQMAKEQFMISRRR